MVYCITALFQAYRIVHFESGLRDDVDCAVYLQEGIQPMWEDERNKQGGRWLVNLDKRKRGAELDRFWLETVSKIPAAQWYVTVICSGGQMLILFQIEIP